MSSYSHKVPLFPPLPHTESTYPLVELPPPPIAAARVPAADSWAQRPLRPLHVIHRPTAAAARAPVRPSTSHGPRVEAWLPVSLAALAAGGKLLAAIGASATVQAGFDHSARDIAVGASLLGVGLSCAVTAAILFGVDAHRESPNNAHWLKAVSISAAVTLAAGAALHQYAVIIDRRAVAWGAYGISAMGFAAVSISLPRFFSYSEAQRGRSMARTQDRARLEQALGTVGLACLGAFAGVGPSQTLPPYVGSGVITVSVTLLLLHMAFTKSDHYRHRAQAPQRLATPPPASLGDDDDPFVAIAL